MSEQKPSVGRVVHYQTVVNPEVLAAIIARVNDGSVVLFVMDPGYAPEIPFVGPTAGHFQTGVPYSEEPKPGHWNWPPRV